MKAYTALLTSLFVSIVVLTVCVFGAVAQQRSVPAPIDSIPGVAGYHDNPYTYRYGNVQSVTIFKRGDREFTNLLFKPVGTYLFFNESITLCGNQNEKLDFNTNDTIVIVHSKLMHRRDCYDLLRIDVVQKARTAGQQ